MTLKPAKVSEELLALDKDCIAAVMLSEPVLRAIRRELGFLLPDTPIKLDELENIITREVIKRELVEGEDAQAELNRIRRSVERLARQREAI